MQLWIKHWPPLVRGGTCSSPAKSATNDTDVASENSELSDSLQDMEPDVSDDAADSEAVTAGINMSLGKDNDGADSGDED